MIIRFYNNETIIRHKVNFSTSSHAFTKIYRLIARLHYYNQYAKSGVNLYRRKTKLNNTIISLKQLRRIYYFLIQ